MTGGVRLLLLLGCLILLTSPSSFFISAFSIISKRASQEDFEECYIDDVALIGGDLPKNQNGGGISTDSIRECIVKCHSEPDCHYWTFVDEYRVNCYLKSKDDSRDKDMEGAITGWKKEDCSYPTGLTTDNLDRILGQGFDNSFSEEEEEEEEEAQGCAYDDIAFLGKDLPQSEGGEGVKAESFEACGETCSENNKCNAWNFVGKWAINCYLKSGIGERSDLEGSIAGTLYACGSQETEEERSEPNEKVTIQGDECWFHETNFLGGDLDKENGGGGLETPSADDCSAECRKRPQCGFWTYVGKWKVSCYLKSRLGEKSEYEGGISGSFGKNCDSDLSEKIEAEVELSGSIPDGGGCRFPGINFLSGDLPKEQGGHGIESKDADDCREKCTLRRNCQFWTHVKEWKINCYLKESKGPDQELHGATSGSILIPCDEDAVEEDLSCLEDERDNDHECRYGDTNFIGADLPESHGGLGITTGSNEECRKECFKRLYCKHWTRVDGWKVDCYLKTSQVRSEHKEGATSGSVGLPCNITATLIQNNPKWTTPEPPPAPIVPSFSEDKKVCVYEGINYQGGDLREPEEIQNGLATSEHSECAEECAKIPTCSYWTFIGDWKVNCYLKSTFTEESEKEGAISGSVGVDCDPSKSTAKLQRKQSQASSASSSEGQVPRNPSSDPSGVCFFKGVRLHGGDLPESQGGHGLEAEEPGNCAVTCYKTEGCKYWVFVEGWKISCYLKESFEKEETQDGVTSGSIGYSCQ